MAETPAVKLAGIRTSHAAVSVAETPPIRAAGVRWSHLRNLADRRLVGHIATHSRTGASALSCVLRDSGAALREGPMTQGVGQRVVVAGGRQPISGQRRDVPPDLRELPSGDAATASNAAAKTRHLRWFERAACGIVVQFPLRLGSMSVTRIANGTSLADGSRLRPAKH
jgi:hypothetical protein